MRQASNHNKRVLQAAKLAYANKTKSSSLPRDLALWAFDELTIVFLTKVNLLYLFYTTTESVLTCLNLMTQISLYLFPLLELISNCIMAVPISTRIVISYAMNMVVTSSVISVMNIYIKLSDELLD